jgi:hypothetical protein
MLVLWALATVAEAQPSELDAFRAPLASCVGADDALHRIGERYEARLMEARYDDRAPEVVAFREEAGALVLEAFMDRRLPRAARTTALDLLLDLEHPGAAPVFARMLERHHCPPEWTSRAAEGLASIGSEEHAAVLSGALAWAVPEGRAPHPSAWSICGALAEVSEAAPSADAAAAIGRLFFFAPHAATEACLSIVLRAPDVPALARRVLDGEGWPARLEGADPRDPDILPYFGPGAALLVLGALRTDDAFDRLARATESTDVLLRPVRDGAIQGLERLGDARAGEVFYAMMRDRDRRTPRLAHLLLRLGDRRASAMLRDAALDRSADDVETRLAAANAFTLLADGRARLARDWQRDAGRARFGAPFEALDLRMLELARRLEAAERCRDNEECWLRLAIEGSSQESARAFWEIARSELVRGEHAAELAGMAALVLERTAPNTDDHDRMAGALWLLGRLDPEVSRAHFATVRGARAAWSRRGTPMGIAFDLPLALADLEKRLRPDQ